MVRGGVVDDAMAQQRPVLHQPEHVFPQIVFGAARPRPEPLWQGRGGAGTFALQNTRKFAPGRRL